MENRIVDMREEWVKWNPNNLPMGRYTVEKFIQDSEGTKITVKNDKSVVQVIFDGTVPIIRNSVEGIRMRTWGQVQKEYNDKYFFREWFLYKVNNSKLSEWAIEESCGFYKKEEVNHYCIVTSEEMIDILASFEPQFLFTDSKEIL